jgi:CDGSH-type Zn-finger protein
MAEPTITPMNDGPYLVKGGIKIIDPSGNEFQVKGTTAALCRCGNSGTKPFCDGTHVKVGFKDRVSAAGTAEGKDG